MSSLKLRIIGGILAPFMTNVFFYFENHDKKLWKRTKKIIFVLFIFTDFLQHWLYLIQLYDALYVLIILFQI